MKHAFAALVLMSVPALADSQGAAPGPALSFHEREVLAATYMGSVQNTSGEFAYEFDFLSGTWSSEDSLVRQAGAGYGLSEYLLTHRDDFAKAAVEKAIKAYQRNSMPYQSGKLLTQGQDPDKAATGATALALLAALQYTKATGDRQFEGDIEAWKSGLLALHTSKGGFASSPKNPEESPYYNGEAWLALSVHAAEFPKDERVKAILQAADAAMIKTYSSKPDMGFFHWGLMAAAKRYETTQDPVFSAFGAQQATAFLTDLRPKLKEKVNSCYSVEGLAAILPALEASKGDAALATRVKQRIREEMTKNVGFQIVPGQTEIALPKGRMLVAPEVSRYAGAFVNGLGRPQIRIDFTQHCLSALLKSGRYMAK